MEVKGRGFRRGNCLGAGPLLGACLEGFRNSQDTRTGTSDMCSRRGVREAAAPDQGPGGPLEALAFTLSDRINLIYSLFSAQNSHSTFVRTSISAK